MWTTTPTFRHRAAALLAALVTATALVPLLGSAPAAAADEGGRIVFASEDGGDFDVITVKPDGSGRTNLTASSSADDMGPVWFGSTKIAFASDRDGDFDIYTMNADGTGVTQITQSPGYDARPTWSPDGTKIAFVSARSGANQIHIQSVAAPGAASTQRTYVGTNTAPSWGAGNRITFTRLAGGGDNEIMVMNADGSGLVAVTSNAVDDRNSRWVSPTRVTFQSNLSGFFDIVNVNVDGSNRVVLTAGLQPSLSPGGTRMTFIKGNGSGQELYVANANGTARIRLTTDGRKDETPDWGTQPISFVPREQTISNIVATPHGLSTTVTFTTRFATDDAYVELRRDAGWARWKEDTAGSPTKTHSLKVEFLDPNTTYALKVFAPKRLTTGQVVVNAGTVKTLSRKVIVTGGWADVIDDSDNSSCGEITLGMSALGVGVEWGDFVGSHWETLCSGEIYDPSDQSITLNGVNGNGQLVVHVGARDDDYWGLCATFDDCSDWGEGTTTVSLLDFENEAFAGSGSVHVLPTDGQLEFVWHFAYTVSYV
jgi:Tol biopolymer transport system component